MIEVASKAVGLQLLISCTVSACPASEEGRRHAIAHPWWMRLTLAEIIADSNLSSSWC